MTTPPQQIGRYIIERELERGGMGVVYLANDPYVRRQVAVKVLPRQLTLDTESRTRFQREAQIVANLEHEYIVSVYDFGEYNEQMFIVMRFMSGGSLVRHLKGKPLTLRTVSPVIQRVAVALDAAHAQSIIHRDIKPGNILFDNHGQAFLGDFGIAKLLAERSDRLTGEAVIGTPEYMSPEQVRGAGPLDGRSDVYALGVVIFEMLAGGLPFKKDTPMNTAIAHVMDPIPDIMTLNPRLPRQTQTVIAKALAKDPTQRYQTAGQLAEQIELLASGRWFLAKLTD